MPTTAPARSTAAPTGAPARLRPAALRWPWLLGGLAAVALAAVVGLSVGPLRTPPLDVVRSLLGLDHGLSEREAAIVASIRLPRVVLGLLVGATLSIAGASYQGAFRNPLADPYLLGAAAGAGLGFTLVVSAGDAAARASWTAPLAAFVGALVAVTLTYLVGAVGGRATTSGLILAGVAMTSFFTALQTYVQQRDDDTLRRVYSWILGRLSTAGWSDVVLLLPYAAVAAVVLLACRRVLDVMAVGDDEAGTLGIDPRRWRLVVVVAASLGTAAAVSVSGLIGFVGLIVPHTVRLLAGASHRVVLPLSLLFGGAFMCLADVLARTLQSPAEVPIGVVTAFFGAPFFFVVLRTARGSAGP